MSFTKVAPAGIGTEPGSSILIGDSLLHSTGIDIGSSTGVGVTIRQHGDATFTGIITASAFFGDGSGLEGVSSSGIGTPLSDDDTSDLNKIYYANQELVIDSTVTVNHPDTGIAAYTHYQDLVVKDSADFIVADGDTFIPDVLGINTSSLPNPVSSATGGRIRAGTITNAGANGAVNFPNGLVGTSGTFTGNLNVAGVLTYEDVTNVDSVGVITARSGIRIGATGANTLITGNGTGIGIGITTPQEELHIRAATPVIRLEDGDNARQSQIVGSDGNLRLDADNDNAIADTNIAFRTDGGERLRIGPVGQIGIGGANYGTSGQVLTSAGSGSAVQWASVSNPTLAHAFVFMDSQYFTSSVTLLEFNNSTTNDKSSGVTITRGGSERFTPTVAGVYLVQGMLHYTHGSGGAYTPNLYLYRNGSSYAYTQGIVNYSGGHYDSLNIQAMMTFNGSSDYVDMRAAHNAGGNATMQTQSTFSMFRVG